MFDGEDFQEKKKFIKIDVEGNNESTWTILKSKLTETLIDLLNTKVNSNSTVKEEIHRVANNAIEFANAKLERPSIENQKLHAEIENLLANKAKSLSEIRKNNAEAEAIELNNIIKHLEISLRLAKILASSSNDPDALLFIKNIEEFSIIFSAENKLLE